MLWPSVGASRSARPSRVCFRWRWGGDRRAAATPASTTAGSRGESDPRAASRASPTALEPAAHRTLLPARRRLYLVECSDPRDQPLVRLASRGLLGCSWGRAGLD